MLLKNLCIVSSNNYQKKDNWNKFNYLDTGSLIKNNIIEIQTFNNEKDLPSRAKQKVNKGNILYSSVRPNQEHYGYIDKDYDNLLVSTGFIILIPNEKLINPKYLYYYLAQDIITNQMQSIAQNSTSAYPSITKDDLLNIEIDLPDRKTQDKIVEILSNIDNQIEQNNSMVKRLQDLASSTYSRWFNQFEFPNEDGLSYKSNSGNFVYNEELKRNIPIGWEVKELPNIFDFLEGPGITKDKYSNIGQNFINIKCLENNFINTNNCSKINSKYLNDYKKYQLDDEDILISTSGTLGTIGIVIKTNLPLLLNTSIIRFRPIIKNGFGYMYSYLTSKYFKDLLYQAATGSIQKNVGPTHLEKFNILIPSQFVLEEYNKIIYPIFKQLCLLNKQNIELNNLKSKLLPLLINGQLEV